jgi:hypothetical protein
MSTSKKGALKSGRGGKVKSRKQAIAIAMHEAGTSRDQSPTQKRKARRKTARKAASRKSASRKTTKRKARRKTAKRR